MTKTTLKQDPNLQQPKDSASPQQIIAPQDLPPTSHRRALKTRAAPPSILSSGSVDWETAKELFDRFPNMLAHHNIAMNFPKYAAATAFIDGVKSVELAQAHLHMSRWGEDRGWLVALVAKFVEVLATPKASITKRHAETTRQMLARKLSNINNNTYGEIPSSHGPVHYLNWRPYDAELRPRPTAPHNHSLLLKRPVIRSYARCRAMSGLLD
ncbi:hypothetical protein BU17DRAFT_68073 [Hysterangium stoloniferum]|nr:hypothetical protein BU17DRAFT_68073 [Hysterangium stoloniferum]